ncbi:MAG: hypothetical protein A2018_02050 [Alphaproteobacteria bacterium GWF2_58_20]|nr:MAG: hypothetical protein A2018_02050 [Alphaproteobacteria bacterium GWF2_58_20]
MDINDPLGRLATHLSDDMAATSAIIGEQTSSPIPLAGAITSHLFSAGGKRTRPLLLLACARLCGYEGTLHHIMAAAAEMIHTATLLHDDVVDKSTRRRGRETAHLLYGEREAILGGDFLLGRAFSMISAGSPESFKVMADAAATLAEGELHQLSLTGSPFVDEEEYFRIITAKTATLFEAVCAMGAIIAGASPEQRQALANFGRHFGIAFQLVDDALDYKIQNTHTGKPIGNDFREGKMTLPVILARAAGSDEERKFWDTRMIAPSRTESDFSQALEFIIAHGSVEETLVRAEKHARNAEECLAFLPHSSLREMMMEAVESCPQRTA